jgi:hypothetical protein
MHPRKITNTYYNQISTTYGRSVEHALLVTTNERCTQSRPVRSAALSLQLLREPTTRPDQQSSTPGVAANAKPCAGSLALSPAAPEPAAASSAAADSCGPPPFFPSLPRNQQSCRLQAQAAEQVNPPLSLQQVTTKSISSPKKSWTSPRLQLVAAIFLFFLSLFSGHATAKRSSSSLPLGIRAIRSAIAQVGDFNLSIVRAEGWCMHPLDRVEFVVMETPHRESGAPV